MIDLDSVQTQQIFDRLRDLGKEIDELREAVVRLSGETQRAVNATSTAGDGLLELVERLDLRLTELEASSLEDLRQDVADLKERVEANERAIVALGTMMGVTELAEGTAARIAALMDGPITASKPRPELNCHPDDEGRCVVCGVDHDWTSPDPVPWTCEQGHPNCLAHPPTHVRGIEPQSLTHCLEDSPQPIQLPSIDQVATMSQLELTAADERMGLSDPGESFAETAERLHTDELHCVAHVYEAMERRWFELEECALAIATENHANARDGHWYCAKCGRWIGADSRPPATCATCTEDQNDGTQG
jgi:hypothetical protein